jgi:hypothetical protein
VVATEVVVVPASLPHRVSGMRNLQPPRQGWLDKTAERSTVRLHIRMRAVKDLTRCRRGRATPMTSRRLTDRMPARGIFRATGEEK